MNKSIKILRIVRMVSAAIVFLVALLDLMSRFGILPSPGFLEEGRTAIFFVCLLVLAVCSILISRKIYTKQ